MINVKPLHTSWSKKLQKRAEQKAVKEYERELKNTIQREKEEKRKLMEERKKRREENIKKAEIVQKVSLNVLNVPAKLPLNSLAPLVLA